MAALVAAAVLLVPSVGHAQAGATAVHGAARTYTTAEVLEMAGLRTVERTVSWGTIMRFAGGMVVAGSLIYSALDWFYDQAQQSTGTDLDTWEATPVPPQVEWSEVNAYTFVTSVAWRDSYEAYAAAYGAPCTELTGLRATSTYASGGKYTAYSALNRNTGTIWQRYTYDQPSQAAAIQTAKSVAEVYYDAWTAANCAEPQDLEDFLLTSPQAVDAVRTQVMPRYVDHLRDQTSAWPYTYAEPYGAGAGISIDPAPNQNQWYDNPYANPQLDTDGDGFADWEEWVAGTNPNNPNEYPTVSPNPATDTDGDGWSDADEAAAGTDPNDPDDYPAGSPAPAPDTDADGIPDQYDPCPFQASNACADGSESESDIEIPDDYAREPTLSQVLTQTTEVAETSERTAEAAEDILEELRQPIDTVMVFDEPEPFGEPDLSALQAWAPDTSAARVAFESAVGDVEEELSGIVAASEGKFPFGLFSIVADVPTFSGSGECVIVPLKILDASSNINLCQTPLDSFLVGTIRPALAALLTIGLAWSVVRLLVSA